MIPKYTSFEKMVAVGVDLTNLWNDQAAWSQQTFGSDAVRGPAGPLHHLKLEADETLASPTDRHEYADLLLLVLDASRRAGISLQSLILSAREKHEINRRRHWPKPSTNAPVLHLPEAPCSPCLRGEPSSIANQKSPIKNSVGGGTDARPAATT
jgi:hypothetical protein